MLFHYTVSSQVSRRDPDCSQHEAVASETSPFTIQSLSDRARNWTPWDPGCDSRTLSRPVSWVSGHQEKRGNNSWTSGIRL